MRKTLALMLCCFGLFFSTVALADVPNETWDTLVGQSVLLTNPQGKEIRGILLDAQGETIRIERADGSVVTVGKSEVITAQSLKKSTTDICVVEDPEPAPVEPTAPQVKEVQSDSTMGSGISKVKPAVEPEPVEPAVEPEPAEPLPAADQPASAETQITGPDVEMQDSVAGEVDGRAAAQMKSLRGPAVASAGVGVASGAVCGCCAVPCAAAGPVIYAIRGTDWVEAGGSEAYNTAYNEAYAAELKKRQWIWTGVGAGTGLVVGLGVYYVRYGRLSSSNLNPI